MNRSITSSRDLKVRGPAGPIEEGGNPDAHIQTVAVPFSVVVQKDPPGPVMIPDQGKQEDPRNTLYNIEGRLFWEETDLTSIADSGSKWTAKRDGGGLVVYRMGKVGIGSESPTSELDVAGTVTAKAIQIPSADGVAIFQDGSLSGGASLADLSDVSPIAAGEGSLLAFDGSTWGPLDQSKLIISHSDLIIDAGDDSHPLYLDAARHTATAHDVPSISVAGGALVTDSSGTTLRSPVRMEGQISIPGPSGPLAVRRGVVAVGITTDDVTEADGNLYHTERRVTELGDGRYLRLDGANSSDLSPPADTIAGLDADRIDGLDASDLALVGHGHAHSGLATIGPDDHHPESHDITGAEHDLPLSAIPGSVLYVGTNGLVFRLIDISTTVGNLPLARLADGDTLAANIRALGGVTSPVQGQLDARAMAVHRHQHAVLDGNDSDDHSQYLTAERADAWLADKDTDDLAQGVRNLYSERTAILATLDTSHLRIDGGNWPRDGVASSNVDMVDGLHADSFSKIDHRHSHQTMGDIGPNDHHQEIHALVGPQHSYAAADGDLLAVGRDGPNFRKLTIADLPSGLTIGHLVPSVSDEDAAALNGLASLRIGIQRQLDGKAVADHTHGHASLTDLDVDQHPQYLNIERAREFVSTLDTDAIRGGITNRYFTPAAARASLTHEAPLGMSTDGVVRLSVSDDFIVEGTSLALRNPLGRNSSATFSGLHVGNLNVNGSAVGIGNASPRSALDVSGTITAESLVVGGESGIMVARAGKVGFGATMADLVNVDPAGAEEHSLLQYDGTTWRSTTIDALLEAVGRRHSLAMDDVERAHQEMGHDVPSLTVGQGVLSVDGGAGTIGINTSASRNALAVNGGIAVGSEFASGDQLRAGYVVVDGRIGIGTMSPQQALHIEGGMILGGSNSTKHSNVLDLSSDPTRPTATFALSAGGSIDLSSDPVTTSIRMASVGGTNATLAVGDGGLDIGLPESKPMSITAGREILAEFTKTGLAVGVRHARLRLDVRGHIGVSDGSSHPKSWVMMRAASPDAPPSVCFPDGGELKFGSMRSYDVGAIWREAASMSTDGTLRVAGRVTVGIARVDLDEGENDDLKVGSVGIIRIKSAPMGAVISGVADGIDGAVLTIVNATESDVGLAHESKRSAAASRISVPGGSIVPAGRSASMVYDGESSRWMVIGLRG